jgi:uncharacterized membrane protein YfcA
VTLGVATDVAVVVLAVALFAGAVTGITGFGFAVVATATLASVLAPSDAVVVLILPLLATNLSLVRELDRDALRSCVRRFWPYVAAAAAGTVVGMAALGSIPAGPLKSALGALTLVYAAFTQPFVPVPGKQWLAARCFRVDGPSKALLGFASGLLFGASNVGIQVVAYLRSLGLDRSTFVGVLGMVLLGVSTIRVGAAAALGLYGSSGLFVVSVAAAVPSVLGVAAGRRIRPALSEGTKQALTLVVLASVGVRLLVG